MDQAIEICNLSVLFKTGNKTITALDRLSLCVPKGQVFGFLGPNGAGKTTAMHVLLGFITPAAGEARIFGVDVNKSIARQQIGYLPEHPDTYRFLTGKELLIMAGKLFQIDRVRLQTRVEEILNQVGLEEASTRKIATYSRGMMQRICLAQALINDPDLLILDEPTGGLDPIGRMEIRKIITSLKNRGKTIFFSSHELSEVELTCDHLAIISKGQLVVQGPRTEVIPAGENLEKFFMRKTGNPC